MASKIWRSNVVFSLGLVQAYLDLWPVKATGTGNPLFRNICPDCPDPVRPNQVYRCPVCASIHSESELRKARQIDKDTLIEMTDDDIAAVRAAYPIRQAELRVCSAEEFDSQTLPSGSTYCLRPAKQTPTMAYLLLRELVATEPHNVYYGKMKADESANPTPFRLGIWKGELIMQSIIPPAVLDAVVEVSGYAEPKYLGMAKMLAEQIKAPLDTDFLADERVERINEILRAKQEGAPIVAAKPTPPPTNDNLLAALEASLTKDNR